MKKTVFIFMMSCKLFYAQIPVTDAATGSQLTALNTQATIGNQSLAQQLSTAGTQLTQLYKTYDQIKKAAEKVENVNSAIDSAKKLKELITLQKESFDNLDVYFDNVKKINGKVNDKKVGDILTNLNRLIADINKVITSGIFNMNDKERIDYMEKRKGEITTELLKTRILKVMTTR